MLERDRHNRTPLHTAAEVGRPDIVKCLLLSDNPHLNVNLIDRHGWTPLHTACHRGDLTIIELLLTGGMGGLHSPDWVERSGRPPLSNNMYTTLFFFFFFSLRLGFKWL